MLKMAFSIFYAIQDRKVHKAFKKSLSSKKIIYMYIYIYIYICVYIYIYNKLERKYYLKTVLIFTHLHLHLQKLQRKCISW